jgi:D-inositol-3-phosphate glycosyltransferase
LSNSIRTLGHTVEVWGLRTGGQLEAEIAEGGVLIRRFAGGQGLIPKVRPCSWVPGWVANAAAHLARAPKSGSVLVSHGWESGVAGKLLADRFGLPLVHVPHELSLGDADQVADEASVDCHAAASYRQLEDEREICRAACKVLARDAAQRDLLVRKDGYAVPAPRVAIVGQNVADWTVAARQFVDALPRLPRGTTAFAKSTEVDAPRETGPGAAAMVGLRKWHPLAGGALL